MRPRSEAAPDRIASRVARSTTANFGGQAVALLVWLALTPFLLHQLGATDYGLWVLATSLAAYGGLLDLGVGAAVTKYVAELRARGESGEASSLIATSLRLYVVLGGLVLVLAVPAALLLGALVDVDPEREAVVRWVVVLAAAGVAVQLPAGITHAVLRGLQRYDVINLVGSVATLTLAACTVAVLLAGGGLIGVVAIIIPLTLLWQVPLVLVIRRIAPDLRIGWRGARRDLVRTVIGFGSSLLLINSAGVIKKKTDELVIAAFLPVARVAPYAVARRLSDVPELLSYQFIRVLMPLAAQLHGERDAATLRRLYLASTRVTLALFVPVALAVAVLAEPLLTAWVGAEYADDAAVVLILVGAGALDIAMWPAVSVLQATNGHRPLAVASAASALLNLALSIALVGPLGVPGVALGTLIAAVLEVAYVLPLAMRRHGIGAALAIREAIAPALLPALPAAAALVALRDMLAPKSLLELALVAAAGALVYLSAYACLGARGAERHELRRVAAWAARPLRAPW